MLKLSFAVLLLLAFTSCSTFRHAKDSGSKINLHDTTLHQLSGRFRESSIVPSSQAKASLSWDIFDRGINHETQHDYIEIKTLNHRSISVSYWDSTSVLKSKVFKGKIKNGYFVFRRRYLVLPFVVANLFRNRVFRIGLLPNGNVITDYNQVSFGSFYVILPFADNKRQLNVEFERIKME